MNIPPEFYSAFVKAYEEKKFDTACELVLSLFSDLYPEEMKSGLLDKETVEMYLSVLEEQKIDLKAPADIDLFLVQPAREKLFGIEEDDDDWSF